MAEPGAGETGVISATEKKAVLWKENPILASIKWVDRNLGPESSRLTSEKIHKLLWRLESKIQIAEMVRFLKSNSDPGDSFFDQTRSTVVGIVQGMPKYPPFQGQDQEKKVEIQRWGFSTYAEGLLNTARSGSQSDPSICGIAWSLLAKDARDILAERGQTIDGEWLFKTMGPLMRTNADPKSIGEQLSKFTNGDPEVIHKQSPVVLEVK